MIKLNPIIIKHDLWSFELNITEQIIYKNVRANIKTNAWKIKWVFKWQIIEDFKNFYWTNVCGKSEK